MTLIAALPNNGTPALIGDVMLSSVGEINHSPIPTLGQLPVDNQDGETRVSGAHRKLCIINPRLVVGWTGRLGVAAHLVLNLSEALGTRESELDAELLWKTLDESWATALHLEPEVEDAEIILIGWIIDRENYVNAFEWSKEKKRLHGCKDVIARGSGANDLIKLLESREVNDTQEVRSPVRKERDLVGIVACLLGSELATRQNIKSFYGGGYDIAILTESGFCFLDSILYVPIVIENIEGEHWRAIHPGLFLMFSYVDGNLLILRRTINYDKNGQAASQEDNTSLIGKFQASKFDLSQIDTDSHRFSAASTVALILMTKTKNSDFLFAAFVHGGDSKHFRFTGGKFGIKKDLMEQLIALVASQS